uniref:SCP domain-containing protein n=1 Tax=Parastrongyloides trichosuri TaxID=131310 RepID=A0A0N4ZH92_PARTI
MRRRLLFENRTFKKTDENNSEDYQLKSSNDFDVEEFKRNLAINHNIIRIKHHVQPLKITTNLMNEAQRYADHLAAMNNGLRHDPYNKDHGENLYYGSFYKIPSEKELATSVIGRFYDEKKYYNYNLIRLSSYHRFGHFTQMIWKSSTEFGIGVALKKVNRHNRIPRTRVFVVIRYNPEGNVLSEEDFKENVL